MKKLILSFCALSVCLFTILSLASCGDADESDPSLNPEEPKSVSAKVGDKDFIISSATAGLEGKLLNVSLIGTNGDFLTMTLILENIEAQTIELNASSTSVVAYRKAGATNSFTSNASTEGGQVMLTKIDTASKLLSGTFTTEVQQSSTGETHLVSGSFNDLTITVGLVDSIVDTIEDDTDGDPDNQGEDQDDEQPEDDEDQDDDIVGSNGNSMRATVSGVPLFLSSVNAELVDGVIKINGSDASGINEIKLEIPESAGAEVHELPKDGFKATLVQLFSLSASSGSITISEIDLDAKTVSGTFSFVAQDDLFGNTSHNVTGDFSITF